MFENKNESRYLGIRSALAYYIEQRVCGTGFTNSDVNAKYRPCKTYT